MENFYRSKKIFITGNTGFKGTWLSYILLSHGARLCGYSDKKGKLFELCGAGTEYETIYGDIRNYNLLEETIDKFNPDIVIHMAAQPLVLEGYKNPRDTFEVNVMGTVNLMTAIQRSANLGSVVNVTTDKVYKNFELDRAYREEDQLGGVDPYSCSKSCSELTTYSFSRSFQKGYKIATARAGNVIGGGDFAENRILPDCIKAAEAGEETIIRNPKAVRPWQHVLEPLHGYLLLAKALYKNETTESAFNFGPEQEDCIEVEQLVQLFCNLWGNDASWKCEEYLHEGNKESGISLATLKESALLTIDSSKARKILKWNNHWNVREAVKKTVDWHKAYMCQEHSVKEICLNQIKEYEKNQ